MAHHQHTSQHLTLATQGLSSSSFSGAGNASTNGDDDPTSEADEPPDNTIHFAKLMNPSFRRFDLQHGTEHTFSSRPAHDRTESLLTQALLSSPEMTPMSDIEAPVLTSDGGLTSPARTTTPSPPTPTAHHRDLDRLNAERKPETSPKRQADATEVAAPPVIDQSQETNVEAGLGRKRCISFACGRQSNLRKTSVHMAKERDPTETSTKVSDPLKRPCLLKFVCPTKPPRTEPREVEKTGKRTDSLSPVKKSSMPFNAKAEDAASDRGIRTHQDSKSIMANTASRCIPPRLAASSTRDGRVFNRVDFQKSEATRFHEFAGPFNTEDEWTNEQTAYRQKITVNDTLRKENAFRKLAEEAEEEALEEEAEGNALDDDQEDDNDLNEDDNDDEIWDDGNESDNEEGFADSDDESDGGSDYQFWTPGLTTAATSTDHLEHIRPMSHRTESDSSIESSIHVKRNGSRRTSKESRTKSPQLRPGTPELPDPSDFVVGTIDEDQPLEEAYLSCLEERRRSRHKLIPQDIDPSFPTSETEPDIDDDDDDDDDENDDDDAPREDGGPNWVTGGAESYKSHVVLSTRRSPPSAKATKSPIPSPKRMYSPPPKRLLSPPPRRATMYRSPPPRRLFGQATHRLRSPTPNRKIMSPPSSRRPSISGSPPQIQQGVHLAQRPNLTHTTSLPKTPNPFWLQHRRSRCHDLDIPSGGTSPKDVGYQQGEYHSRGPIDIVQGLESKRQRRRDKFWRQHCRTAGKEKGRRCQPGKGAERMKSLGLEMADRFRGYGQRAQLVLSV